MGNERNGGPFRLILASAPWPLFSRPSIQIGALKAYLDAQIQGIETRAYPLYLKVAEAVGYDTYHTVSERTWLAEPVYGALLYEENFQAAEKVFYKAAGRKSPGGRLDFESLVAQVRDVSLKIIDQTDWGAFDLAGFSLSLCQLTASLFFIRRIKQRFPKLPIVIGGSMVSGPTGPNLIRVYPEIDYLVNGEGELPLARLIETLSRGRDPSAPKDEPMDIQGVSVAESPVEALSPAPLYQAHTLDALPPPDYDAYFELLNTFSPDKRFFPTLPVEASRGCSWRRASVGRLYSGCAFCNLNFQWKGYRRKKTARVVREIDHLTSAHQTLSVAFMDNVLPVDSVRDLSEALQKLGKDLQLFGEIRADFPESALAAMAAAGMSEVQIGIEALGTNLLKKMNKGTTAIENLAAMKHCNALGLSHRSNLILHFPGSDAADVAETLRALEFALPYQPLRPVSFWLGLGSPVWRHPEAFGIRKIVNHPHYAALFPRQIADAVPFPIQAYHGDLGNQRRIWKPVMKKIAQWQKTYDALRGTEPILSFRDGRRFLIIRQKRSSGDPMTHRLAGGSRKIYLLCRTPCPVKEIVGRLPELGEAKVVPFLKMMVDKRLMFSEGDRYLSLAVPAGPKFRANSD